MPTNPNHGGLWTDQIWQQIDDGVKTTAMGICVAQKVFYTAPPMPDATSVPADILDPEHLSITEGVMRPFVEISVRFSLSNGQVANDPTAQTALTLGPFAARNLALGKDSIFFQGVVGPLPPGFNIESGAEVAGPGLINLVPSNHVVQVPPPDETTPTNSGAGILAAVVQGISLLQAAGQSQDFALILDTDAFAETVGSVINGEPVATVLTAAMTGGMFGSGALLAGGIHGTPSMPKATGLLVALGGNPTIIYFCDDPRVEHTHRDDLGKFRFRTFERVQIVARDPRCFVRLNFPPLATQAASEGTKTSSGAGRTA